MKQNFLLLLLSFFCTMAMGQNNKFNALRFTVQLRHELQGSYVTQYGTMSYLNSLKLSGTSFGTEIGYKMGLGRSWYLSPSTGYYHFSVGKIINRTIPAAPLFDNNSRFIDYHPDSTPLGYTTRVYHYNNLSLGIGAGKEFSLSKHFKLLTGLEADYLFVYSANYKVAKTTYKTSDFRSFGFMATAQVGVSREYQKFFTAAQMLLPLYKQWKKDQVLYENPSETVKTWFGGYGVSFIIGKYLN